MISMASKTLSRRSWRSTIPSSQPEHPESPSNETGTFAILLLYLNALLSENQRPPDNELEVMEPLLFGAISDGSSSLLLFVVTSGCLL